MMKRLLLMVLFGICGVAMWAQPQNYDALMSQAKNYFQQKEYAKANECYEQVVAELKGTEYEHLVPTVRNSIAINNMYLGVAALKKKDFPTSKDYLDKAIKDAKPESKTYYMIHSWMGHWYSVQSQGIRSARGNYQQALQLSLEAERYYNLAKSSDNLLQEQLARADILQELSRNEESETLLKQIMKECEGVSERNFILGRAAYGLGRIEMQAERYQSAIQHLEQCYDICIGVSSKIAKTWARIAANKLSVLYTHNIPDENKAALWKQRTDELESQTAQ